VAVIGAGLSGITAGILLPAKVPGIKLQIFDKNPDVGGTWYENIYPGVRCGTCHFAFNFCNNQGIEVLRHAPGILEHL